MFDAYLSGTLDEAAELPAPPPGPRYGRDVDPLTSDWGTDPAAQQALRRMMGSAAPGSRRGPAELTPAAIAAWRAGGGG